ncbi:MAG: hypothetical protein Q4C20_15640 [Erysipelotrichaceae bacterium]|nr:hypothetical protein [Erysipelotrichaceae bacterium]
MANEIEYTLQSYLNSFIEKRVEQLTGIAEKQPDYLQSKQSIKHLIDNASQYMEPEDLDTLINAVRGADISIYEYMYHMGIRDGIWLSANIDQIKNREL